MRRHVLLLGLAAVIGCGEDDGGAAAGAAALPRAASYRVEGSTLSLLTAEDTHVATYERAP